MSDNKDEWNELLKMLKLHRATFANDADKLEEDNKLGEMVPLTDTNGADKQEDEKVLTDTAQALETYLK
jgi:hypothetical protein